jgi:hypothetical protein
MQSADEQLLKQIHNSLTDMIVLFESGKLASVK